MAGEWCDTTLGDVIELKRGYDLPQQERLHGQVPVVTSSGVTDHHTVAMVRGPGVVTGRYGTLGQVFFIAEDFWPHNTTLYVRDFKGNDPRFISYFLQGLDFQVYSDKAAVPGLNRNHLHQARVCVPNDVGEQRAIARILGSLDDKIALNRRMNRTLEELAAAIFKAWFVDFDPVVARAEGGQPFGMDAATAALFPDRFEETEMGSAPVGWRVGTVGDVFDLTMGQSPPGTTYNEAGDGIPFYQGRTDFGFRFPTQRVFCTAPTRFAEPGDTLVSVRAPVGDVNMAMEHCSVGRGLAAVRHKGGSRSFTYYAMRSLREEFEVFEGEGTLFGSISSGGFHNIKMVIPDLRVIAAYERLAYPLDQSIGNNERESRTLATLRDALLPKLLSGEIRVE